MPACPRAYLAEMVGSGEPFDESREAHHGALPALKSRIFVHEFCCYYDYTVNTRTYGFQIINLW